MGKHMSFVCRAEEVAAAFFGLVDCWSLKPGKEVLLVASSGAWIRRDCRHKGEYLVPFFSDKEVPDKWK